MVEIKEDELKKLEKIGCGTFGIVYKKDDKFAYKIYFSPIHVRIDEFDIFCNNPSLNLPKKRFQRLIEVSKTLQYSGGVLDTINVDGEFGGVVIPYYSGKRLDNMMNVNLDLKIELSNQLVRNCRELNKNFIYPTDLKLNNIIMDGNSVRIIDLDDVSTYVSRVPNPIHRVLSIKSLASTIECFFKENTYLYLPRWISNQLLRESCGTARYKDIENYIKRKKEKRKILFVNDKSNLDEVKEIVKNGSYKVVFVLPEEFQENDTDKYMLIIERYRNNGINLYDFTLKDRLDTYISVEDAEHEEYPKIYTK